ncbi:hybrid sensor histidine kinase/response regulator [Reichenbachiella versicolor]|uniref:hybrid sensor histidine kinase/response regulator n=1 Tax=Reichenbachiella versicolor TaxID=1821036 RepID=UPI000D6E1200|nr:PAS domain-containing protein [Reichenbachiella versicolor]
MEHTKLNILILEDSVEDAEMAIYEINKAGFDNDYIRVDTLDEFKEKLFDFLPHLIISDYNLPDCTAIDAFQLIGEIDIPFIIVSGTVGEKNAVEALKMGVTDIVSKDSLSMLPLVIERAMNEKKINREKKSAEHELILNKERLELALEGTDMGVWDLDFMSNTIVYNNKSLSILGLSEEDAILDFKYFQEKSETIDEDVVKAMQDVIEERAPNFDHEFPIHRHGDTSKRWVLARGKITRYSLDKRPLRASGTVIDITSRKLSEEKLKKNQAILENAEAVARLGSFEWNSRQSSMMFSEEFRNIFEIKEHHSLTEIYMERVHPQDQPYVKETLLSKKKFYDIEHRLLFDEDRVKIVRNSGYITTDKQGKVTTIMGVVQDITEQREITRSIYNAQQEERARMGRDIHDGIGQMLVAAKFKLSCIDIDKPVLANAKDEVEELLATTLEEVRRVSRNLANRHLEDFGLKKTLEYFIEETRAIGDFHLDSYIDLPDEYDLELSTTIYRIAQEALNNVIKYAKATNVSISVETTRDNIILEVKDDGIGFDTETKWNGIKNMKERTSLQNGHFEIDSVPDKGTLVKSWFPLNN